VLFFCAREKVHAKRKEPSEICDGLKIDNIVEDIVVRVYRN
jgi:hypothetical protein